MLYHITRNGQNYGPYTLEDLRRYVASGNILPSDLARTDDMPDWLPVSQVLGSGSVPPTQPRFGFAQPPGYPASPALMYPDAPNLAWGLVLLLDIFTCTLFSWVWNLVLSSWMKRVQPNSKAVLFYAVATVLGICQMVLSSNTHTLMFQPGTHMWVTFYGDHPFRGLLGLAIWVVRLIARFTMRSELEHHFNTAEPVGLSLSGVMTFFFGSLYFQYHLNRINELKRMARFRGAAL
jgi:hypothetical protein